MDSGFLIAAEEARRRLEDEAAVLVCAYEDEQQCEELALEQSISWLEFQQYRSAIPEERDVIFFVTSDDEDVAVDRALGLRDEGRENAFAIEGGYEAAREVGLVPDE
jgi:hypothetical protein